MTCHQARSCRRQVLFRGFHSHGREWQHPLALASTITPGTDYRRPLRIKIMLVQRNKLTNTHTRGTEHMQHGKVAYPCWSLSIHLAEENGNLLLAQNMGQLPLYMWRNQLFNWVR